MNRLSPYEDVIPLVEEQTTVDKVQYETGRVRVRLVPEERACAVVEELVATNVDIERISVDKFVDELPQPYWDGDVLVVPVFEEVLVTEKKLHLVEEVRIRRRTTTRQISQPVTLRRTEAIIERVELEGGHNPQPGDFK